MLSNKKQGAHACRVYYNSQMYSSLTKYIKADDAIKLFLPPVNEMLIQYAAPLPKDREEWLAGFKEEQLTIVG